MVPLPASWYTMLPSIPDTWLEKFSNLTRVSSTFRDGSLTALFKDSLCFFWFSRKDFFFRIRLSFTPLIFNFDFFFFILIVCLYEMEMLSVKTKILLS